MRENDGTMIFLWFKAFHLIAVTCWFAALFYLPRLFVYHSSLDADETKSYDRFVIMERKLLKGIAYPSLIVTELLGFSMLATNIQFYLSQPWFLIKLALVVLLWVYHGYCHYFYLQFKNHNNSKSHKFFRIFNELPVLALVAIVILVVIKP